MKETTLEQFRAMAETGEVVPVCREIPGDMDTPVSVLERFVQDDCIALLESVEGGETLGRYSFLGVEPCSSFSEGQGADPLPALRERLRTRRFAPAPELPAFQGGAVGFLAYDAVRAFVPRVALAPEPGTPQAAFLFTDTLLVFDNVRGTVTVAVVTAAGGYEAAQERIVALYARLLSAESITAYASRPKPAERPSLGAFAPEMTEAEFSEIVLRCKEAIRAGEVFQIVPSQKFTAETTLTALALYRALERPAASAARYAPSSARI